jgi:hypothetical protein
MQSVVESEVIAVPDGVQGRSLGGQNGISGLA